MLDCLKNAVASNNIIIPIVGLVVSLAVVAFSIYRYLKSRSAEIKQERFKNYHNLIDELVEGRQGRGPRIDNQIAIVYELRNYREYREVSIRILEGLKHIWEKPKNERLLNEILISLSKLKKIVWVPYLARFRAHFTSYNDSFRNQRRLDKIKQKARITNYKCYILIYLGLLLTF